MHGCDVGDVDEFGAADGEDGDGDGEGGGAGAGEEVDDVVFFVAFRGLDGEGAGFFVGERFGFVVVVVVAVGAPVVVFGAGRGFFFAGEVAVVQVGFGVRVDAEVAPRKFVAQFGRGEVHLFLRVLVPGFFDHPQARVPVRAAADTVPAARAGFGLQLLLAAVEELFSWGRVARGLICNHCSKCEEEYWWYAVMRW